MKTDIGIFFYGELKGDLPVDYEEKTTCTANRVKINDGTISSIEELRDNERIYRLEVRESLDRNTHLSVLRQTTTEIDSDTHELISRVTSRQYKYDRYVYKMTHLTLVIDEDSKELPDRNFIVDRYYTPNGTLSNSVVVMVDLTDIMDSLEVDSDTEIEIMFNAKKLGLDLDLYIPIPAKSDSDKGYLQAVFDTRLNLLQSGS